MECLCGGPYCCDKRECVNRAIVHVYIDFFNGVGVPAEFTVYTKGAGVGEVVVTVKDDKTGRSIPVETKDNKDGTTTVVYNPDKPGKYTITVTFNGKPIPKSPFKVNISLNNPNKCKAYGPGLEKSTVGEPAKFTIETKGAGEGGLGLTIEGPTEAKVDYKDNNNGSCDVTYYPETPGDYNINILFADKHIPGSPFKAKSSKPLDASKGRNLKYSIAQRFELTLRERLFYALK